MRTRRHPRALSAILGTAAVLGMATGAFAQLSFPSLTNSSTPNEVVPGTASAASRERQSFVEVLSSPAGAFTTRYSSLITTDSDGGSAGAGVESIGSDYQIDFTVTAPGAYILNVTTSISGDLHLVNDGSSASADIGPISGFSTGGTQTSGSLDIADPGVTSGSGGASNAMADGSSATIFGVSNGVAQPHNLHFVFTQIVTSTAGGGDEAAVRLGINSSLASETAGDYPGNPARTLADDGHFVTVTVTSLCGNGTVDSGPSYTEQCDAGSQNGQPGSCCAADCTFVTDGTSCSDNDACTTGDSCQSGVCTPGATQSCPPCQTCDGNSGCIVGPRPDTTVDPVNGCKLTTAPLKAQFQMKDKTPDIGDQVTFKWTKGAATAMSDFGTPATSGGTDYALCVFAANGTKLMQLDAPADGVCGTATCWKTVSVKGFNYKDPLRTPNGVDKIALRAGLAGKAKVLLKGKADNLPTLPLPLPITPTDSVTVQLQGSNGKCWSGVFSNAFVKINTTTEFKGKAN